MTVAFQLSKREHWAASRAVQRGTLAYKLGLILFGVLPVIILVVTMAGGASLWSAITANPFGILAGPVLLVVGFPLLQYWSVWTYHRNHPTLRGEQSFSFTPTHLKMSGPLHNTDLDWGAVRRVVETPSFFLFYISKTTAYFLPLRAIPSGDLRALREQLTQWLPGRVAFRERSTSAAAA